MRSVGMGHEDYRDLFQGERLFVCGNGPSLAQAYPLLRGEPYVFGCNWLSLWRDLPFPPLFYGLTEPMERGYEDRVAMAEGAAHRFILSKERPPEDPKWTWLPKFHPHNRDEMIQGRGLSSEAPFRTGANTLLNIGVQFGAYMGFKEIYLLGLELPECAAHTVEHVYDRDADHRFYKDPRLKPQFVLDFLNQGYERAWRDLGEQGRTLVNCTPVGEFRERTRIPYRPLEEVLEGG